MMFGYLKTDLSFFFPFQSRFTSNTYLVRKSRRFFDQCLRSWTRWKRTRLMLLWMSFSLSAKFVGGKMSKIGKKKTGKRERDLMQVKPVALHRLDPKDSTSLSRRFLGFVQIRFRFATFSSVFARRN